MRLATARTDQKNEALPVVIDPAGNRVLAVRDLMEAPPSDTMDLLDPATWSQLERRSSSPPSDAQDLGNPPLTAPYRHPRKIWGIGLNYVDHASDLSEKVPDEPASFIKGDHTIIGPGEPIPLPAQSDRVTAEAEMGLVIGSYCRDVSEEDALAHVAGIVPVLDQTAEDILARNPRFLTRSKNFPGFFSFGPHIIGMDEVLSTVGSLADVEVATVIDEQVERVNTVAHMRYSPEFLVSFHSRVMPLFPGDIISTGTPGAVPLRAGMEAQCRITGLAELRNPVGSV